MGDDWDGLLLYKAIHCFFSVILYSIPLNLLFEEGLTRHTSCHSYRFYFIYKWQRKLPPIWSTEQFVQQLLNMFTALKSLLVSLRETYWLKIHSKDTFLLILDFWSIRIVENSWVLCLLLWSCQGFLINLLRAMNPIQPLQSQFPWFKNHESIFLRFWYGG